jgi:hypothetical protein
MQHLKGLGEMNTIGHHEICFCLHGGELNGQMLYLNP